MICSPLCYGFERVCWPHRNAAFRKHVVFACTWTGLANTLAIFLSILCRGCLFERPFCFRPVPELAFPCFVATYRSPVAHGSVSTDWDFRRARVSLLPAWRRVNAGKVPVTAKSFKCVGMSGSGADQPLSRTARRTESVQCGAICRLSLPLISLLTSPNMLEFIKKKKSFADFSFASPQIRFAVGWNQSFLFPLPQKHRSSRHVI